MSPLEKQDLVFFWTGSPALPGLFTFCFNFLHCSILFNFKVKPAKDDGGETLKKRLQKKKTQRGQRFLFTIFSSFVYFFFQPPRTVFNPCLQSLFVRPTITIYPRPTPAFLDSTCRSILPKLY